MSLVATPFPRQSTAAGDLLKNDAPHAYKIWNQSVLQQIKPSKPIEIQHPPNRSSLGSHTNKWSPGPATQQTTSMSSVDHRSPKNLNFIHWEEKWKKKKRIFPKKSQEINCASTLLPSNFFWRGTCVFPNGNHPGGGVRCESGKPGISASPWQQVAVKTWLHLHGSWKHLH